MGFLQKMKGMIGKLFAVRDIQSALGIEIAMSQEMMNQIDLWSRMYAGRAPWIGNDVSSLRLESAVCRELSNITLSEMTAKVSNDALDGLFHRSVRDIAIAFQEGLASGAMIIKPLGEDKVQFVSQNAFIPVEYDVRGVPLKVIFPEFKQLGENRHYTRLEFHSLDRENGLTITNKAYFSTSKSTLGREVSLDSVKEWANLQESIRYPLMKRNAFGYYRNPIRNTIDGSPAGVSVFENAAQIIRKCDIQFGRLDWEFESGERAVHVSPSAIKADGTLPKLNRRLYRAVDVDVGKDEEIFKEYSPQLRQTDLIAGLEEYKRNIEFETGLSYGDISNPQTVDKTATEIKASKKRKFDTVTAIQNNLKNCLDDYVYALAFWNGLTGSGYEFVCDFKDSILADDESERAQDRQDVSMGVMRLEEYRSKWYGETLETARASLPDTAQVIE